MLSVEDLYVGYHRGLDILKGVSLTANGGQVTAILGANGVGKSTLLKAVAGLLRPTSGRIIFDDNDITGVHAHDMIRYGIAYSPQQPGVFTEMSVEENILVGAWTFRNDRRRLGRKLDENYERFPVLKEKRRAKAGELSGGQRRAVELARALMAEPAMMLIDEPSAGLAPIVAEGVYEEIARLRDTGIGVVLVDQDIPRALDIADYVYVIDLGQNRLAGRPQEFADLEESFWTSGEVAVHATGPTNVEPSGELGGLL